jgi:hypothetical protein
MLLISRQIEVGQGGEGLFSVEYWAPPAHKIPRSRFCLGGFDESRKLEGEGAWSLESVKQRLTGSGRVMNIAIVFAR